MRQRDHLFWGVFAQTLSLDQLYAKCEEDGSPFDLVDAEPTPDRALEVVEAYAAVRKFVDELPPRDREIVRSVFWDDRSQSEVAIELKVSKMAISKAVARICARGRLTLSSHQFLALVA